MFWRKRQACSNKSFNLCLTGKPFVSLASKSALCLFLRRDDHHHHIIKLILIRVYPRNRGGRIYPCSNLSKSHFPSCFPSPLASSISSLAVLASSCPSLQTPTLFSERAHHPSSGHAHTISLHSPLPSELLFPSVHLHQVLVGYWIYISYIFHIISLHGKTWTQQIDLAPKVWLHSSVDRASHRYHGGHKKNVVPFSLGSPTYLWPVGLA